MYTIKIKALFLFYVIIYFFTINNIWSLIMDGVAYLNLISTNNINVIYFIVGLLIMLPISALFVSILFKTVKKNEKKMQKGIIKKWVYYIPYIINIIMLILFFSSVWNEVFGILAYMFDIFNRYLYLAGLYFIMPFFSVIICFLSFGLINKEYFPKE